jgi:flagellar biosynthesis/type III secretory pathway protein FliH
MKSSARLAPAPSQTPPADSAQPPDVMPFPYCSVAVPPGRDLLPLGSLAASPDAPSLAASSAAREAQARELWRQQGERESRAKFDEQLGRERSALAKALEDFTRERAAYYRKIEQEAVQLALNIARKILHREAQVDPLLLMGIVRVALEQIEGASGVILAVHPQRAAEWRKFLAAQLDPGDCPEIFEDPAMASEQCELRTSMGTARLGLEMQFKEIEQGLMDLLAARPEGKA